MSGQVFHPGHEDLHGITVVVTAGDGRTYVGRYHERGPRGVVMHDVAVFDPATHGDRTQWLNRQLKFGVQVGQKVVVVPETTDLRIDRLTEIPSR